MIKKIILYISILLTIALILYIIWPSDYKRIKNIIKKGKSAIENESIEDVMSLISFNYRDEPGLTYFVLKKNLEKVFHRLSDIEIEYKLIETHIENKTAKASLEIRVIGSIGDNRGYIIGDFDNPELLILTLEKEHLKWLVIKSDLSLLYILR